jgi:hypothetical protein
MTTNPILLRKFHACFETLEIVKNVFECVSLVTTLRCIAFLSFFVLLNYEPLSDGKTRQMTLFSTNCSLINQNNIKDVSMK